MRKKIYLVLAALLVITICTGTWYANSFSVTAAASTMPAAGTANLTVIDISQWNDSVTTTTDDINFPLLKTQVDAVYIRAFGNNATGQYVDFQANNYAKSAQKVNLLYGFYYYYLPKLDPEAAKAEAQAYYAFVKNYAYSCMPALDVEENPNNLTKSELAASVKAFADEFKRLSGFDIMIYSYPYFMMQNFDASDNWIAYHLWLAHYGVSAPMEGISSTWMPSSKWCWERWDMWQYSSTGILSSVPNSASGRLDINHATDNILLSTPKALSNIESPSGTGVNGGDININGWALSHSGVDHIDIYADDARWIGTTSDIYERPDVQAAMNGNGRYNDGLHSGFSYTVDASLFTVGEHILKIGVVNRNESVDWINYKFRVGPDPLMNLESPASINYGGDVNVSGWAVSHAGISRVDIYMDDNIWIGSTANIYARSDVNSAVNAAGLYKDGLHSGFSYTIDASQLTVGSHTIRVAAISKDGSAQWTYRKFSVGTNPQMNLESPVTTKKYGDVNVAGWAVSYSGVSRVDIYVDNNRYIGSTSNIYARSDVNTAINSTGQYKDALHCGFSYTIDASQLTVGTHVIRVAAISKDGSVQWVNRNFTVAGAPSQMCLDAPSSQVTGSFSISGWAISNAGLARVDIYVDNNVWVGSTSDIYQRTDVNAAMNPNGLYKDALNSGFTYLVESGILSPGQHVLRVAAISKDGSVQWTNKTITVQ
jgi:GH25 family lysozyme M1 (1,4-beta-N-acetylmuramidase)